MADSKQEEPSKEIVRQVGGSGIFDILKHASKQIAAFGIIYLIGYFNISPAWLLGPLVLSVMRDQWKKNKELKRNVAKASALSNEKDVILARIDELPAWVFFPDVERCEWLNRILLQVWPNVNHYAKDVIKDIIEPNINVALAEYKMSGFKFQKMRLGTIPPRFGGIKVYDRNTSRNEIIMDVDVFYAGDCDISFVLSGFSGGIKDFQIHGLLRIVMKPLITTMPLVGGLQIFFLNNPAIDFNLVGVADLLDMPGLSDMLRRIIVEQVAAMMVLPNKLPIKLSEAVASSTLRFPEPEGVLRVHVVEAKQLMKKDISMLGKGKSDPYVIVTVGAQTFKSKTIDNTVDPKWDFWCEFVVEEVLGQILVAKVFDKDNAANDDALGRASVEVHGVTKKGILDTWVTLEEAKTGMVHLRLTWLQLTSNKEDLKLALAETQQLRLTSMATSILMVYIDCVRHLPSSQKGGPKPDPMMYLTVGKISHTSHVVYRTDCPVFERGFTFLVNNPETDTLHIRVVDQKSTAELGRLSFNLSQLLEADRLELDDQPLALTKSGPDSKVLLSMKLKILKHIPVVQSQPSLDRSDSVDPAPSSVPSKESTAFKTGPSTSPAVDGETDPLLLVSDPMVVSTPPTLVESAPTSGLHQRTASTTSSSGEAGLGRIQLTFRYSVQRQRLIIVIHKIANLPLKDPSSIPDPYVKLYLLPERSKETKRKTETVKDNCNPTYDETFEYLISLAELHSRQLEVTVLTQKTWKSPVMGQVIVNLSDLDLSKATTQWFDLKPEVEA
ncbi:extended synaptotagmin-2 isoform X2 [Homalodisca vitripennis]|nr:extended synaptotagmin-2 isoform X2 [Homalodisca vitripennis]